MKINFSLKAISFLIVVLNVVLISSFLYLTEFSGKFASPLGDTVQVINAFFNKPPKRTVYGYLPYWMMGNSKYLQYDKLTDIAFFSLHLDSKGNFVTKNKDEEGDQGYETWKSSPQLRNVIRMSKLWRVRFALTLTGNGDEEIDEFLACRECWETALLNTIAELKTKGIKDINLDFEHSESVDPEIADLYTQFASFMNSELDKEFFDSKVVVAAFADSYKTSRVTNPTKLAEVVDGVFIMAYDFHAFQSEKSGPVSPLRDVPLTDSLDIRSAVERYKKEVSPLKLILGVPYYGYNFLVEEAEPKARRKPGNDEDGFTIAQYYAMIRDNEDLPLNESKWDEESNSPYLIYKSKDNGSTRILYYENKDSLEKKYKFALEENLAGIGIWALGYDGDYKELWNLLGETFKN